MTRVVPLPLAVPGGPGVAAILPDLERALAGRAPIATYAAEGTPPQLHPLDDGDAPDDLAVVVGTSGSTGKPKRAMLSATALRSSARATHAVLGGDGFWLLALPAHHVAGLQVLVRSLVADTAPTVLDLRDGFTASGFVQAAARMTSRPGPMRRYTAIVPTQLARLLGDPVAARALADFDGVLVGGAATPRALLDRAAAAGVTLLRTYGMSETAGGCVYDGLPLPVSSARIDDDHRVVLGGDTVAHGYLGDRPRTAAAFATDPDGTRWFRTDDLGHWDDDERLVIDGRADDVITSGAVKIMPGVVEDALVHHLAEVRAAVVVGVPDPEWGEIICAAVVLHPATHAAPRRTELEWRSRLRGILPDAALPRRVLVLETMPLRGPGKPDREAVRRLLRDQP